jgi:peptidoglycan/LPS O-acetylase OafA/YrhL
VTLAGWPLLFALGDTQIWIVFPLVALLLCAAAFRGTLVNRIFRNPIVTAIGGMCYSIYLFHYVLIPPVLRITKGFQAGSSFDLYMLVQALWLTLVVMLVSSAYFLLVERPCMKKDWPRRVLRAASFTGNI